MKNDSQILKKNITEALNGSISCEEFINWFEDYFYNLEETSINASLYSALEELYEGAAYYEPNVDLESDDIYFGDDELKAKLRTISTLL